MDSHGQEPGGHGAKAIKQVAVKQTKEVAEEGGDSKDQREPLILFAAICERQNGREAAELHGQAQVNYYCSSCFLHPPGSPVPSWLLLLPETLEHC